MFVHEGAKISAETALNAGDLINQLLQLKREHPTAIFRGQSEVSWSLTPSLWRSSEVKQLVEKWEGSHYLFEPSLGAAWYAGLDSAMKLRASSLCAWLHVEQQLTARLVEYCERCALPYPRSEQGYSPPMKYSGNFGVPYPRFNPWIAFAQHYGVPTRLLDFSDNPMKALYFAVHAHGVGTTLSSDFEVVAAVRFGRGVESSTTNLDSDGACAVRALRGEIPYLHAQDGLFLDGKADAVYHFMQTGFWPRCLTNVMDGWSIHRVSCSGFERPEIAAHLETMGIDHMTMKPSPETASNLVMRQITDLSVKL